MEKVIEKLKAKGVKPTAQRLAILKILIEEIDHYTVDSLYKKAIAVQPTISQATVYSIIELFAKKGIVQELRIDGKRTVYDPTIKEHHHFMCRNCGQIRDIEKSAFRIPPLEETGGHKIEDYQLYFYGLCSNCR